MADNLRRKNERFLKTLHPVREKDDLETYIKGLEHTLIQCQVDEEEWLFYPTANMMGKYATLVQGLLVAEDENCVSGYPVVPAGRDGTSLVGKRALEVFQLVTRLIDRIFKGAVNMQECAFALAMPVFRKLLLKEGMAFLDQKCPKSMEKLMDTLQQWWAIARGRPSDEVSKPKTVASHPSRFASVQCFSLGKMGHRALECRAKSSTSSHNAPPAPPHPHPGRTAVCGRASAAARRGTSHQLAQTEPEDAGLLPVSLQRWLLPTN